MRIYRSFTMPNSRIRLVMEVRNYERSLDQYTIGGTRLLGKRVYYYTKTTRTYSVAKHSLRIYLIKNNMMEVHHANMSV